MKRNIGMNDRLIRLGLAAFFTASYLVKLIQGDWGLAIVALAVMLLVTALMAFSPLYAVLGIDTMTFDPSDEED